MSLQNVIQQDIAIFFNTNELAQTVSYIRDGVPTSLTAVIFERELDADAELATAEQAEIWVKKEDLDQAGLNEPQNHDFIEDAQAKQWEVLARKENMGIWELSCERRERPRT